MVMNIRTVRRMGKRLKAALQNDVDPKKGTTIRLLDSFLRAALGGGCNAYYGTFPADKIPQHLLEVERFQIVLNTSRTTDPPGSGGHFIVIEGNRDRIMYIDPFGKPCTQPNIVDFILGCGRTQIYFNETAIQDKTSVFCPLYCALFILYHHLRPSWSLDFSRTDLKSNDQKCLLQINKLIRDPRLTPRLTVS